MEGVAGPPLEGGDAAHPTPNMATREQPPSKRRRVGVVWDEGNLAKHSAERVTPDHASEEHVFYVDVSSRSAKERHPVPARRSMAMARYPQRCTEALLRSLP